MNPFTNAVLIISYDLFRINCDVLSNSNHIGLLVLDEGHKLKNTNGSQTLSAIQSLSCDARLLITGTPIQNCLSEFYNVASKFPFFFNVDSMLLAFEGTYGPCST